MSDLHLDSQDMIKQNVTSFDSTDIDNSNPGSFSQDEITNPEVLDSNPFLKDHSSEEKNSQNNEEKKSVIGDIISLAVAEAKQATGIDPEFLHPDRADELDTGAEMNEGFDVKGNHPMFLHPDRAEELDTGKDMNEGDETEVSDEELDENVIKESTFYKIIENALDTASKKKLAETNYDGPRSYVQDTRIAPADVQRALSAELPDVVAWNVTQEPSNDANHDKRFCVTTPINASTNEEAKLPKTLNVEKVQLKLLPEKDGHRYVYEIVDIVENFPTSI